MSFVSLPPSGRSGIRRSRMFGLALVVGVLATGLTMFAGPVESASALAIDCGYTPGLSAFIGDGRDGVTCMGGGERTPSAVYGSGSLPGQAPPAGMSIGSVCRASAPQIPDRFYGWGAIAVSSSNVGDYTRKDGSRWHVSATEFYREGKPVATEYFQTSPGRPFEMSFRDITLDAQGAGVWIVSTFNCQTDSTWVQAPFDVIPPRPVAGDTPPDGGSSSVASTVLVAPTMAPVPFQPNTYFLRIDVTSRAASPSTTPVFLTLDLADFSISGLVTEPRDSSCPSATSVNETCVLPQLSAGETQTLTFVVTKKVGSSSIPGVWIDAAFDGYHKVGHVNRPGIEWTQALARPRA